MRMIYYGTYPKLYRLMTLVLSLLIAIGLSSPAFAQFPQEVNGLFFWGGGFAALENNRSNELFTDSFGRTGFNDGTNGWFTNAGWDLPVWGLSWGHVIVTEVNLEFKRFASGPVLETEFLQDQQGGPVVRLTDRVTKVRITETSASFSPKYRFDNVMQDGRLRPWVIPVGLDISAIGPFTSSHEHLEVGLTFGMGVDYKVTQKIVFGLAARYDAGFGQPGVDTSDFTVGGFIGISY